VRQPKKNFEFSRKTQHSILSIGITSAAHSPCRRRIADALPTLTPTLPLTLNAQEALEGSPKLDFEWLYAHQAQTLCGLPASSYHFVSGNYFQSFLIF